MDSTFQITDVRLLDRPHDGHKGTFGRVLVVAGSRGMSGAAVLCSSAALRGGAGLVTAAVPQSIQAEVAIGQPCATTIPLADDESGQVSANCSNDLGALVTGHDVIAAGPGLGTSSGACKLIRDIVCHAESPLVLDADALNVCAQASLLNGIQKADLVVTPHPGEFSRLTGLSIADIAADPTTAACNFATTFGGIVALKGHRTVVTDGKRVYRNETGNSGMATGGSGDVLTGVIAALIAQGIPAFEAAVAGICLHGIAGDISAERLSEEAMIASDLVDSLGAAWRVLRSGQTGSSK